MGARFVAKWPDGTESRVAWALWMVVGLVLGVQVAQATVFIGAAQAIARSMGNPAGSLALVVLGGSANALLVFTVLMFAVPLARRRLLMPEQVWVAFALAPALLALSNLRPPADAASIFIGSLIPVAIFAAWWRTGRSDSVNESAVETSAI